MLKLFLASGGLIFCMLVSGQASAQVVDMRAYSRQHGFKAYQAKTLSSPVRKKSVPVKQEKTSVSPQTASGQTETTQTAARTEKKQLRQTGIKIFQEKDENKVMNFDVENPEFKKLNKEEQQDLLNRITIE